MEENKKEQEKKSNFKAVQDQASVNKAYKSEHKAKVGFANGFLLPFVSGVLGCTVVVGTCFGVPSIKNKLLGSTTSSSKY